MDTGCVLWVLYRLCLDFLQALGSELVFRGLICRMKLSIFLSRFSLGDRPEVKSHQIVTFHSETIIYYKSRTGLGFLFSLPSWTIHCTWLRRIAFPSPFILSYRTFLQYLWAYNKYCQFILSLLFPHLLFSKWKYFSLRTKCLLYKVEQW